MDKNKLNKIRKTAIIGNECVLGDNIVIGPYCVISGNVKIANNNIIESSVFISGNTEIGEGNRSFHSVQLVQYLKI